MTKKAIPRSNAFYLFPIMLAGFLICGLGKIALADDIKENANKYPNSQLVSADSVHRGVISDDPEDPENTLAGIQQRRAQKNSLFPLSPLNWLHEASDKGKEALYNATHLKLGLAFTHAFQWLSEAPLGEDTWGTASDLDFMGTWELVDRGGPTQGQLYFQFEGRWEYGTTGPERLGTVGLGSLVGTANTFSQYGPKIFIIRNLYWQQGSQKAGWAYRIGKITTDATLSTSAHISSIITFLPTAGTGPFSNALTDSGLGIAGVWYINNRVKLLGIISDANANRQNFGDITAGDFYKAVELAVKIAPLTKKAGYSKITLWHTDATEDGQVVNGHLGPEGWGFFLKHEQELRDDGEMVGVLRYGKSYNNSAFYDEQFGAHFLFYNPTGITNLHNDLFGVAFNYALANIEGARNEYNIEMFYRFPLFPQVDTSLSYQSVINPALDPNNDHASVFSIRLRTTL